MTHHSTKYMVGLDVGSTTVKAMVTDVETGRILWQDYQRHETKQAEKVFEFMRHMESDMGLPIRMREFLSLAPEAETSPI